ncbi:MAG: DmsC/YnfH family molybdoenzyme membrane anchor subunit [Pseudomonadota bacterium]
MHPAYSVILFTTASGAGYGLMFWVSLIHISGAGPDSRWFEFTAMAVALILVTVGLLASTFHLGHPERAFRAFSQWRSSWLSREGVAAVATYAPSGLLALIWLLGGETAWTAPLALLAAVGAVVTVYCTGMIYASLRTIRQWNLGLVPVVYLGLAAASGAVLLAFFLAAFGQAPIWAAMLSLIGLGGAAALKALYWRRIDADPGRYTVEMALGLSAVSVGAEAGGVRPLDPPHTRPNFVMREMGYQVARKHALKLRQFSLIALFAAPAAAIVLASTFGVAVTALYLLAAVSVGVGAVLERWLFFAEAEHVVTLYYGANRA